MGVEAERKRSFPVRAAVVAVLVLLAIIRIVGRLGIAAIGLPVAFVFAIIQRFRRPPERPRVLWSTGSMIGMANQSRGTRLMGYESETITTSVFSLHRPEDFDHVMPELLERKFPPLKLLPPGVRGNLYPFLTFCWALGRFDIFVYYSGTTILRPTAGKYLELQLLKLARKRMVLLAYGADVQTTVPIKNLLYKHALVMDYPQFVRHPEETLRMLSYCSRYADHIQSGIDWVDYMPWWDSLTSCNFAVDTEEWKPARRPSGSGEMVKVFHAPNHRTIKGTQFLIDACDELKAEGVPIELVVVQGLPNLRVRQLMAECDILADQFIIGWYAMFAIEGMALGKPVLCYLRPDLLDLYTLYSFAGELPLVDTHPLQIKDRLRELVEDAQLRADLGERGRRFVEDHHSLEAVGQMFDGIFRELSRPG
jgi:glycosyltransferase involved in cell wall biosynthesis